MNLQQIIEGCRNQDEEAQKQLYDRFAPKMFGLCKRYVRHHQDAEDVLIEGMFKTMTRIDQFSGKGNFESWMKRIFINEALMFLRKKNITVSRKDELLKEPVYNEQTLEDLTAKDLYRLLDQLPKGYRTVFNLYVVDGYKHREIAEILGISINTSKSQLILAKKKMQELMKKHYPDYLT